MLRFVMKRIIYAIITIFLIITATFFLVAGAPGDPIAAKCKQMPEASQEFMREKYGLNKPIHERYIMYMKDLLKGDFGQSIMYPGVTVTDVIKDHAPVSAKIAGIALVFQLIMGVFLGLIAGINRNKVPDHIIRVMVVIAICVPSFVFAAVMQYFVAFKWGLTPVFGWGDPIHYVLPVVIFSITGLSGYCKYTRNSTINVLNEDYIVTAKAKGCSKSRMIKKHVVRNVMIPIVTMIGPAIAGIFMGSFVTEKMFGIPGIGQYYVKAVNTNDHTMILGLTIFFAMLYVVALVIVDILYGVVDPRIRVTKGAK